MECRCVLRLTVQELIKPRNNPTRSILLLPAPHFTGEMTWCLELVKKTWLTTTEGGVNGTRLERDDLWK
jgi:hypothetical protein